MANDPPDDDTPPPGAEVRPCTVVGTFMLPVQKPSKAPRRYQATHCVIKDDVSGELIIKALLPGVRVKIGTRLERWTTSDRPIPAGGALGTFQVMTPKWRTFSMKVTGAKELDYLERINMDGQRKERRFKNPKTGAITVRPPDFANVVRLRLKRGERPSPTEITAALNELAVSGESKQAEALCASVAGYYPKRPRGRPAATQTQTTKDDLHVIGVLVAWYRKLSRTAARDTTSLGRKGYKSAAVAATAKQFEISTAQVWKILQKCPLRPDGEGLPDSELALLRELFRVKT